MISKQPQHPALPSGSDCDLDEEITAAVATLHELRDRGNNAEWITDATAWLVRAEALESATRRYAQLLDSGSPNEISRALFQLRISHAGAKMGLSLVDEDTTLDSAAI